MHCISVLYAEGPDLRCVFSSCRQMLLNLRDIVC